MPTWTCDRGARRAARTGAIASAAIVVLIVIAGCSRSTAPLANSGSGSTTTGTFQPTTEAPATSASRPVDVAEDWLVAYRSISWTDGTPTAWIARVRPYVTAALDAEDEQQYADAGGGADWQAFVAQQCTSTVTDVGAVIPPESPGTTTDVNVQVTATVHTICDAGEPENPTEDASTTVIVTRDLDGSWRVIQRLY